ncbi:MAG: hypothetical protein RJA81_2220, partial [Planctomycetota bacterium]
MKTTLDQIKAMMTRRSLFSRSAHGIGTAALASLMEQDAQAVSTLAGLPHLPPKAKNVIYLFQNGGPSHVDTFDYKPELRRRQGQQIPDSIVQQARFSTMTSGQTNRPCL